MSKKISIILAGAINLFITASCSSDDGFCSDPCLNVEKVVLSAKGFEYDVSSRTSFNISSSGAEFLWAENDTVGIFPDKGNQVEFPMTAGAGTKTAAFDGGGWGLKGGCSYYAYYPFSSNNYFVDNAKTKIPVSYANQTQTGNGNLDHLGAYDYMVAKGSTPEKGGLNFNFEHLGALVQLTVTIKEPTILKSIILETANEDFTIDGYVDITSATPSIIPTCRSKTLAINLNEITTTSANESVVIYFMIPPIDLSASTLALTVVDYKYAYVSVNLTPKNFQAGRAYALKSSVTIPYAAYGHEYVDLGLPSGLLWATCNLGAETSSDYGELYAWGETETKDTYSSRNAKFYNYYLINLQTRNVIDANCNLLPSYDAAATNWGGNWRIPTRNECQELLDNCTWSSTNLDGKDGVKITGPNGNSIFLPEATYRLSTVFEYEGSDEDYLVSYYLWIYSTYISYGKTAIWEGLPIRPVININ